MLGWFTKKKTVEKDTAPVPNAMTEHETNGAEFAGEAQKQSQEAQEQLKAFLLTLDGPIAASSEWLQPPAPLAISESGASPPPDAR